LNESLSGGVETGKNSGSLRNVLTCREEANIDHLLENGRVPPCDPPEPDKQGRFEPVIGLRPDHWPWVLPHLYAMNVSPEISGAVVETIGYWQGVYAVFDTQFLQSFSQAKELAAKWFEELPIRHLMEKGVVIGKRPEVEITGEWPKEWKIRTFLDVKILAAYLFEVANAKGGTKEATRFRQSLGFAWPMTEVLILYRDAFTSAQEYLSPHLDDRARGDLKTARELLEDWLKR
jgi:hypothetical protein